ncbi:amidohydrolase family protein [Actinomadura sp. 3N407]|uniref:amidohydrolase family protein n=1 Tax=Actinomadura sp. 3N407 TaxID=3457423 RepID=UPI003FCCF917
MAQHRVFDGWVNLNTPEFAGVFTVDIYDEVSSFFSRPEQMQAGTALPEMIKEMRAAGIERAVLTAYGVEYPDLPDVRCVQGEDVVKVVTERPELFTASAGFNSPRAIGGHGGGITAGVRRLATLIDQGLRVFRIVPFNFDRPPTDACFYPYYSLCEQTGTIASVNVGVPGPKGAAWTQDPLHLDRVLRDFPDLTVIASHTGHPWEEMLIRLMMKYENLYLMTTAYSARYLKPELVSFMRSRRGRTKVMFASGWPLLGFGRAVGDALRLDLPDEAMDGYLYANLDRVLRPGEPAAGGGM